MPPKLLAPLALMALLGVPLGISLIAAILAAWDVEAWQSLLADSQTGRALGLSLWTGVTVSAS